ncbi:hypothetical protein V3C99_010929 [Haemonchus contortus]
MSILADVELFGGLVIGDGESATLPSGPSGGLSSTDEIFNTSVKRFRGVRYVLVGTQIDKRLSMPIENYGCDQKKYLSMPVDQAESRYVEWNGASNTLALRSD